MRRLVALAVIFLALTPVTAFGQAQIDLAWDAATDNVAVAGYQLYTCTVPVLVEDNPVQSIDAQIQSGECTVIDVGDVLTYSFYNMPANITYYWAGTAYDNADVTSGGTLERNESIFSNVVSQTVGDTTPPSKPGNVTKAVVTGSLTGGLTGTYTLTFEPEEGVIIE
jgi:hypothetical protein